SKSKSMSLAGCRTSSATSISASPHAETSAPKRPDGSCSNTSPPLSAAVPATPPNQKGFPMSDIHPAPTEFDADQIATDPILRYFHYSHLPAVLQGASKPFCDLARHIVT